MLQKLFTFLVLMFLVAGVSRSQDPGPPTLYPGEKYTDLWSVSYDYQTNGSVRYLVQDPSNPHAWCAIIMSQKDSSTAVGVGRYIYYAYSDDGGNTWSSNVLDISTAMGFPCLTLSNGDPVIAAHRSGALGSFAFKDSPFGGFSFSNVPTVPTISGANQPIWPHIAGTTNGNLVMVAAPNDGANFFAQRTTYSSGAWSPYVEMPQIGGPSGNFDVAAGGNGKCAIIGYDYVNGINLTYFTNETNGTGDWSSPNIIAPYILEGSDTLFFNLAGGYQSVYDNAGNLHIICAAYNAYTVDAPPNTARYIKSSIFQWTQAGGFVKIASKDNILNLADTLTQALQAPLTQPSISKTASGRLIVSYTAFLWGNTQVVDDGSVVNAGEIFVSYSDNNGSTWSSPKNITNTPNIEEKHSSLAPTQNTDSLRIYYVRDLKAGGWVNVAGWGKAPVYGIFKADRLTGIKEDVSVAKSYELFQNYPNPFNPSTSINYYIEKTGMVTMKVFDMLGREVRTLVNEVQNQGPKEITFDGSGLSSGIYYYSLTTGDFKDTKKMMLIK